MTIGSQMIIKFILFILIFLFVLHTPLGVTAQSPSVYSGVYTENDISSFEKDAGKGASLVMFFHAWNAGVFPTNQMTGIRSHGSIPVVSWQSYDPYNANSSWENIGSGKMDNYITQWAKDSKNWGHPYFLRFDWEMNGYWEPNSAQSDKFVWMWKHVHDIFVKEGATNVSWVWCPNIDGPQTRAFDSMYPGSDYVNWVCMDGYNFGTSQSWGTWQSFSEVFGPTYNHLLNLAPGKPIMIAEMSSSEQGGAKGNWITDMLNIQLPTNFPAVKAFIWFNINKEADWRIESSDKAKQAYFNGISSNYYAANSFSDFSTSPIPYFGSLSTQITPVTPTPTLNLPTPTPIVIPIITSQPTVQPTPIQFQVVSNKTEKSIFEIISEMLSFPLVLEVLAIIGVIGTIMLFIFKYKYPKTR